MATQEALLAGIKDVLSSRNVSVRSAALKAGLPIRSVQNVLDGHDPRLSRAAEICDALGLEFYIGPPRGDAPTVAKQEAGSVAPVPEIRSDMEVGAHSLNRAVVAMGGNPIPEDLWPVLDERRGIAAVPMLADSVGDGRAGQDSFTADGNVLMVMFAKDVRAAAGSGELVFEEAVDHRMTVPRSILPDWAQPEGLTCIRAAGDSMEPGLRDGDMILLDRSHTEPADGQVFVLHTESGLVVKRLRETEKGWTMTSDNPAYPPRRVEEQDRPVGRLAWSGPLPATEAHAGVKR